MLAALLVVLGLAACGGDDDASGGASAGGSGDPIQLTYASPYPETDSTAQVEAWWRDEIARRTDGAVEWEVYPAGTLLGITEIPQGLADGRVDAGTMSTAYAPDQYPLSSVVDIPFTTSNMPAVSTVLTDLVLNDEAVKAEWAQNQIMPMGQYAVPPSVLGTKSPVEGLSDLQNVRIRSLPSSVAALEAVGADPVIVDTAELYESLERGVLDGFYGKALDAVYTERLYEPAPKLLDPGLGIYGVVTIGLSPQTWEGLPPEVQEVVRQVGDELAAEGAEILAGYEEEGCDELSGSDVVEFSVLPPDEVEQWETALGDKAFEAWSANVPEDVDAQAFYDQYRERLATAEEEFSSYEPGVAKCTQASR